MYLLNFLQDLQDQSAGINVEYRSNLQSQRRYI